MKSGQERLIYSSKEIIAIRDMILFQASLNLESIAPKTYQAAPAVTSMEHSTRAQVVNNVDTYEVSQPLLPSDSFSLDPEANDRTSRITTLQKQVSDIHEDILAKSKAA